jgi:hypothetical protein
LRLQVTVVVLERLLARGELADRDNVAPNLFANGFRPTKDGSSSGLKQLETIEAVSGAA